MGWTYWALNGEDSYDLLDGSYDATPVSAAKQSLLASIQFPLPGAVNGTPPPTGSAAPVSCSAAYSLTNSWAGGFQAQIVLTNTGTSAISPWTLTWTFPGDQKISQHVDGQLHPVRGGGHRGQRALQRHDRAGRLGHHRLHRHLHQQRRGTGQLRGQRHRVQHLTRPAADRARGVLPSSISATKGRPVLIPRPLSRALRRPALRVTAAAAALLLAGTGAAAVAGPAAAQDTAVINGATTYQTMTGFGASEAFGEAQTVMNASASVQQQALSLLYSPTIGAGLTMLRNEISADSGSTIEPTAPAQPGGGPGLRAAGLDQPGRGPAVVRPADQGRLRGDQRVRGRVERAARS